MRLLGTAFGIAAFGILLGIALGGAAAAQDPYPNRPVRMIVPYPPGGVGDTTARVLVPRWSELLGQQIVVENRPGAGSNIGTEAVARAAPDGYTIGFFDSAFVVNPSLHASLPFDPVRDFVPIMVVARGSLVLVVHPSVAAGSVGELIALAKAKPGALSYASAGNGTAIHLAAELFKFATGVDIVHIPFKGAGPASLGVVSGEVPMMFALPGTVRGHTSSGKLRAIAITGARRFNGLPDVPTFGEARIQGVDATLILELMAPARTSRAIVDTLSASLGKVLAQPDITDRLGQAALEVVAAGPDRAPALLRDEMALWARVIRSAGVKAD